jgi:hypothetical protein
MTHCGRRQGISSGTDKAMAAISPDADWAFYIQGDEVVHEKYLDTIREAMEKYQQDKSIEGLCVSICISTALTIM